MARILITGASQGIGRATAVEAIRRGHDVIATARKPEVLDDIDGLTGQLRLDVTDQATVDSTIADAGPIDVLISNAGETIRGTAEATPPEEFQRLFDLNTIGPSTSFVADAAEYRELLDTAGFAVVSESAWLDFALNSLRPSGPDRPVVMGEDAGRKVANLQHDIETGLLVPTEILARRQ